MTSDRPDRPFAGVAATLPLEIPERLLFFNLLGLGLGGLVILGISALVQPNFDPAHPLLVVMVLLHALAIGAAFARRLPFSARTAVFALLCFLWAGVVLLYVGPSSVVVFLVGLILLAGFLHGVWGLVVSFLLALLLWVAVATVRIQGWGPAPGEIPPPDSVGRWTQTGLTFGIGTLLICGLVHQLFRRTAAYFAEEARLRGSLAQEQALRADAEIVRLRAELARREAERTLEAVFRVAPIGVAVVQDRTVTFVNGWLERFLGRPAGELVGRSTEEFYASPGEFHRVGRAFAAAAAAGSAPLVEAEVSAGGDGRRWVLLAAAPAQGGGQQVVTVSDITALKRAEHRIRESESRLAEILNHTSDLIFSLAAGPGPGLRIEWMNRAARDRGLEGLLPGPDDPGAADGSAGPGAAPLAVRLREAVARRRPLTVVEVCALPDGPRRLSTVLVPVLEPGGGEVVRLVGFARDLTDQDRVEEIRREKLAADAANQAKSSFLSQMSHEIRTPLNAVLGFTRLLLQDPRLDDGQRGHLATIDRNGEHLLALINDILEISRIEAAKVVLRETDSSVRELLDYLRTTFGPGAQARGLGFTVAGAERLPEAVALDEGKLRQILLNLVGNAVKFTAAGEVRVEADLPEPGRLVVRVTDTGPGLAPEEVAMVFRDFEQTELGRRAGGSGLGLAISRGYAKLMGGDIEVSSVPGRGSVFTVVVPCAPATRVPPRPAPPAPVRRLRLARADRPVRVLVVDDVSDNRVLLSTLLRAAGFEVREATSGSEALQALHAWQPHAAIVDLKMPGLDGIAATRRMRAGFPGSRLRILGMSASVFSGEEEQFRAAGADAFLAKPVRDVEILENLGRLLGLRLEVDAPAPAAADAAAAPGAGGELRPESPAVAPLLQAVEEGDYQAIRALLDRMEAADPELVADLRGHLQRFDYDAIRQRIACRP